MINECVNERRLREENVSHVRRWQEIYAQCAMEASIIEGRGERSRNGRCFRSCTPDAPRETRDTAPGAARERWVDARTDRDQVRETSTRVSEE